MSLSNDKLLSQIEGKNISYIFYNKNINSKVKQRGKSMGLTDINQINANTFVRQSKYPIK